MTDYFEFELMTDRSHEISTPLYICCGNGVKLPCKAVWDTGATGSMISADIAKKINLQPAGKIKIAGVHGVENSNYFYVTLNFDNGFEIPDVCVAEASNNGGFDILIGMDIIGQGHTVIEGGSNGLRVIFRFPLNSTQ